MLEINDDGVVIETLKTGIRETIPADAVVLAMGVRPVNGLVSELKVRGVSAFAVGDAVKSGTIAGACHSACDVVMNLR